MFHSRVDSTTLPASAVLLWYTLMGIANTLYWKRELPITISQIESKSKLSKATICRMRNILEKEGLINYHSVGGRNCGIYKMVSFEYQLVHHSDTITDTIKDLVYHNDTITETLHKHKTYITNKENIKRKNLNEISVGAESPPTSTNPTPERKEKSCAKKEKKAAPPLCDFEKWLEGIELPWTEVMRRWLEYKVSRKERYKSEVSMETCLKQLKKFSAGDPKVAQEVVDQSIANNWAGLFELKRQPYYARGQPMPALGQHIGQIKQPKDEEARQKILDKFKPQPIKHKP